MSGGESAAAAGATHARDVPSSRPSAAGRDERQPAARVVVLTRLRCLNAVAAFVDPGSRTPARGSRLARSASHSGHPSGSGPFMGTGREGVLAPRPATFPDSLANRLAAAFLLFVRHPRHD